MGFVPWLVLAAVLMALPTAGAQEFPEYGIEVRTLADGLKIPWAIDFAPDGRIFFTERGGQLWTIQNDSQADAPLVSLDVTGGEGGLLGLALDPDFESNGYVYLYHSYSDSGTYNRIIRYTESDGMLSEKIILIDRIPGGPVHDGGRIKFGPDGMLYATTGDASRPDLAQDLDSLAGKILRLKPDGAIPEDNPFEGSPVFSYGHRNPQGIDWHTDGTLLSTEHGPSGERGVAHDEINVVRSGGNYGWPDIVGAESAAGLKTPAFHTGDETWAPAGAAFYDSDVIPHWKDKLLVATLRGEHLRVVHVDSDEGSASSGEAVLEGKFGRLRDVLVGPEGYVYVLTSNRDGRGMAADDKILVISPLGGGHTLGPPTPPLWQVRAGVAPHDVRCGAGLGLLLGFGGAPACVTEQTLQILVKRGWEQPDT